MVKQLLRVVIAVTLVVIGWSAGRAQTTAPDFEFVVTRHQGGADVQVECKRGCRLGYVQSGTVKPAAKEVGFACKNEARCDVTVAGWVTR